MGKFKKTKRKLGEFLKDKGSNHSRKGLMKLGFGLASGVLVFNIMLSGTAFAHANTPHNNVPEEDVVTGVKPESVATHPKCWRLVPAHTNTPHNNVAHTNTY